MTEKMRDAITTTRENRESEEREHQIKQRQNERESEEILKERQREIALDCVFLFCVGTMQDSSIID